MDSIDRLISLFQKFPGIGPRQAQRFVQFLLRSSPALRRELVEMVQSLSRGVHECESCMRFFSGDGKACSICNDKKRDESHLCIVATDADLAALESSSTYRGHYFVLGGLIYLATEKTSNLRLKELKSIITKRVKEGLRETTLAFPANPEGDATADYVREEIKKAAPELRITALGRGLSTGSELEYADAETLKNAFDSRR